MKTFIFLACLFVAANCNEMNSSWPLFDICSEIASFHLRKCISVIPSIGYGRYNSSSKRKVTYIVVKVNLTCPVSELHLKIAWEISLLLAAKSYESYELAFMDTASYFNRTITAHLYTSIGYYVAEKFVNTLTKLAQYTPNSSISSIEDDVARKASVRLLNSPVHWNLLNEVQNMVDKKKLKLGEATTKMCWHIIVVGFICLTVLLGFSLIFMVSNNMNHLHEQVETVYV